MKNKVIKKILLTKIFIILTGLSIWLFSIAVSILKNNTSLIDHYIKDELLWLSLRNSIINQSFLLLFISVNWIIYLVLVLKIWNCKIIFEFKYRYEEYKSKKNKLLKKKKESKIKKLEDKLNKIK